MSLATSNRDGGKTSESGHLRPIQKVVAGEVLNGLAVSQRAAGANMSVDLAIGDAVIPRSDGTYGHPAWNDAVLNVPITTADPSNPRRDIVVMYIDYAQTPSTAVSNNTNGVVKVAVVAGTAAGSPSDPSAATIQSAVGSGNPYIKLARVRVAAGTTTISNGVIDDLRTMATGLVNGGMTGLSGYTFAYSSASVLQVTGADATDIFKPYTRIRLWQAGALKEFIVKYSAYSTNTLVTLDGRGLYTLANTPIDKVQYSYLETPAGFQLSQRDDFLRNHFVSGCIWTADNAGTNRNASMSAGVVYINGKRLEVDAVSARTFAASSDTYVDFIDAGNGKATPIYTTNTVSATSPTLASTGGSLRGAIITTGASSIATSNQVYNGGFSAYSTLYGSSSTMLQMIRDLAGEYVHPRSGDYRIAGAGVRAATATTGAPGAAVSYNGMPWIVVNLEPYTDYEIVFEECAVSGFSGSGEFVISSFLGATGGATTTKVGSNMDMRVDGTTGIYMSTKFNSGANSGKMFLTFRLSSSGWSGTMTLNADTTDRQANFFVRKI